MAGTTLDIQEMIGYARGAVAVMSYSDCARAIGLLDGPDAAWKQWHDNGIGIPPGNRDKLFQPFFTTNQPARAPGLGCRSATRL